MLVRYLLLIEAELYKHVPMIFLQMLNHYVHKWLLVSNDRNTCFGALEMIDWLRGRNGFTIVLQDATFRVSRATSGLIDVAITTFVAG